MKILGFLIIFSSLILTTWWTLTGHQYKSWAVALCFIALFIGIFFILQDRAIEISFKGVGTITAAAEQAATDAKDIANLKKRIEAQSATVDLVAQNATEAQKITNEVSQKNEILEEKVKELNNLISEATDKLQKIETITEFSKMVVAAQNDDRRAFDTLASLAENKSSDLWELAANTVVKIRTQYGGPIEPGYLNVSWKKGIVPTELTLTQIRKEYQSALSIYKADLVNWVWKNNVISKYEKMQFFIDVLKDDDSLTATFYAGKFFVEAAGDSEFKWSPFSTKPLLDWWDKNKDKINKE